MSVSPPSFDGLRRRQQRSPVGCTAFEQKLFVPGGVRSSEGRGPVLNLRRPGMLSRPVEFPHEISFWWCWWGVGQDDMVGLV